VANLSHRFVEDTDWEFSEFSVYDLGQAVAHMSIQAQAIGRAAPGPGRASSLEDTGEPVRSRRALDEILWPLA
jgi:hypothetical protein